MTEHSVESLCIDRRVTSSNDVVPQTQHRTRKFQETVGNATVQDAGLQDNITAANMRELKNSIMRLRTSLSALVHQFQCPLTKELMVDPVIAGDGQTYERIAIEEWLRNYTISPVDNSVNLGSKLLIASRKTRSAIETLVESGNLDAPMCNSWAERKKKVANGEGRA